VKGGAAGVSVRSRGGLRDRLARLRGSTIDHDLTDHLKALGAIGRLEPALRAEADAGLRAQWEGLRARLAAGTALHGVRDEAFALVREAARRTLGQRPYDEQVMAGLALHEGHVVEMATGEGKTLAAVMPAALNALAGRGVHVLTFNDYLARRDAEWMGPVYAFLGPSVGWIQGSSTREERHRAYAADVTYVTAKEAGFDHLRDLLAIHPAQLVHRPFHLALVDEADSLLIDEARVPLVIAGSVEERASSAEGMAALVAGLEPGLHFDTDEYVRDVELTEAGALRAEEALGCGSLHVEQNYGLLTELNCALHARVLLRRDVDYIVRDGRIEIVDELTGRVAQGRHWPDGLQAALEAKEGLARRADGAILGSITLQHFLALYPRLGGMTGTARDAAEELHALYGLRVAVVPTHAPVRRLDHPDVVFTHRQAKEDALVEEVRRVHATGRPILVGTLTVAESDRLAARLRDGGMACAVLNARDDSEEAAVIAGAGAPGALTISTNMAGRGTDIRLGGPGEARRDEVAALGGLYVIGTNRHESRRIDLQLRGRAGRQGDPGESRFFVSLEDDLAVRYGLRGLLPERAIPEPQALPIESPLVRREIERVQRIVDGQNFEIRRTLWRYASAIEDQRQAVQDRRTALLLGHEEPDLWREDARYEALAAAVGEAALREAERAAMLFHLDRAWRDHLALVADLREGIHLVRLGGEDPLTRFKVAASEGFRRIEDDVTAAVRADLDTIDTGAEGLGLAALAVKGPSSTWTYLVNDDPFRDQLGAQLTGPGRTTVAMGMAVFATPLLILLGLADRLWRKRPQRRSTLQAQRLSQDDSTARQSPAGGPP
jgi:preprotein translocase subunit SecA